MTSELWATVLTPAKGAKIWFESHAEPLAEHYAVEPVIHGPSDFIIDSDMTYLFSAGLWFAGR